MADSDRLRVQRTGTIINATSKQQEKEVIQALYQVVEYLGDRFGTNIVLSHEKKWLLKDMVGELRLIYPDVEFYHHLDTTYILPDAGILLIESNQEDDLTYPILIAEVKNQGTNDRRLREGKTKQSKGNAIERLGKNVIGLRTALMRESIFPFVCFGYGCDFEEGSSILDRVSMVSMFGKLNETHLYNEGNGKFNRGSFYFREEKWTVDEMANVMIDIAERSILYYFSKYREDYFKPLDRA